MTDAIALSRRSAIAGLAALVPASSLAQDRKSRDREAIKAMAGNYRVRFDFHETASFVPGYKPLGRTSSGGDEAVRVIEDTPDRISLQHLIVANHGGETFVIKHWRHDWVYEPREILTYDSLGKWALRPVSEAERQGAWSQTVWQTDDSPRYGGVGRWTYDNGVTAWQAEARRPLARRDAVRKPPYSRYEGFNRHALTPTGWVHEQGNAKLGVKDGRDQVFVHEVVLNTYERFEGFPVKAADEYWASTKDYWAAVRLAWDESIRRGRGVAVTEEADMGSVTSPQLMGLADEIHEGKIRTAAAVDRARRIIATAS
jgi:hypothetical protein